MQRTIAVLIVLAIGVGTVSVPAGNEREPKFPKFSVAATETDNGPVVQITIGELVFSAPQMTMTDKSDKIRCDLSAKKEEELLVKYDNGKKALVKGIESDGRALHKR